MVVPTAAWSFRWLEGYSIGWMVVPPPEKAIQAAEISQADCLFSAAWMAFSPWLDGPTVVTLIPLIKLYTFIDKQLNAGIK